jgi:drug/metabolite transporter (DMT)-like permease
MPHITLKPLIYVVVSVGLSAFVGDLLYAHSINMIGASLAVSVSSAYPLVVTFSSILILGERITAIIWGGTILIIAGLVTIELDAVMARRPRDYGLVDIEKKAAERRVLMRGIFLAICAAICWGVSYPMIKLTMTASDWTPIENYFLRSVAFFCWAWGMRLVQHVKFPNSIRPLKKISPKSMLALAASALLSLTLGGILYGTCVETLPVSVVTPITASSPFITVILSRIFFKEKLSLISSVGVIMVVVGSIAVSL